MIFFLFAALILNRTPVKRVCEILEISSDTYYRKLEWIYRRCLEFLERHEQKPLENKQFDSLWLKTDKLQYNLNNVRKKGNGSRFYDMIEVKKPQHISLLPLILTQDMYFVQILLTIGT